MKFRLFTPSMIELTESNLNRVVNGHDKSGYAILSAERQDLWKNRTTGEVVDIDPEDDINYKKLVIGSQEHIDANNIRTRELKTELKNKHFSHIPVFGGFKEEGQPKANIEHSFIVMPFDFTNMEYIDFDTFIKGIFKNARDFRQDAILVKYPQSRPRYYDPSTEDIADEYEFVGTTLNDITQEYFTALKKWDDISKKDNFTNGKPQRFSFYMNDFPKSNAEHQIRSNSGEMVRMEKYPKD